MLSFSFFPLELYLYTCFDCSWVLQLFEIYISFALEVLQFGMHTSNSKRTGDLLIKLICVVGCSSLINSFSFRGYSNVLHIIKWIELRYLYMINEVSFALSNFLLPTQTKNQNKQKISKEWIKFILCLVEVMSVDSPSNVEEKYFNHPNLRKVLFCVKKLWIKD